MTDEEEIIEKKALELTAQHYLDKMMKSGWTSTHTEKRFDHWDVTISNGKQEFYTETKIRFVNPDDYKDEGALIDEYKVNFLQALGMSIIVQFFPCCDVAYVWPLSEKDTWKQGEKWCKKTHYTNDRKKKKVWYMPFDTKHKRYVDMSDYEEVFNENLNKVKNEGQWR